MARSKETARLQTEQQSRANANNVSKGGKSLPAVDIKYQKEEKKKEVKPVQLKVIQGKFSEGATTEPGQQLEAKNNSRNGNAFAEGTFQFNSVVNNKPASEENPRQLRPFKFPASSVSAKGKNHIKPFKPVQLQPGNGAGKEVNKTQLSDNLKSGIETLSGIFTDNLKTHYNSSGPVQQNARAHTKASETHFAPEQEKIVPPKAWNSELKTIDPALFQNTQTASDGSAPVIPVQLVAVHPLPNLYYDTFLPKYKVWRPSYWSTRKIVFNKFTIAEIMEKLNSIDPTHLGADGTHKNKNSSFITELKRLNELKTEARNYHDEDREKKEELSDFQAFVEALDRFLDKWEDSYGMAERKEKERLAEITVKVTKEEDLEIYYLDEQYKSRLEQYRALLKNKILSDKRLVGTLRGKDSFKLHLQDDDPGEIAAAIDKAVDKLRTNFNLDVRIKPTEDTEWKSWRKNDCVFAAIIFVMNNDTAKYKNVLGENPKVLNAENAERDESVTIANKLGIGQGVLEDPVIFNIMSRLGWTYIANQTWNSWVVGNKYAGGTTYVISYSRSTEGDANHTVVFKDGEVYDRQGQRLGGAADLEPTYKEQPMEIWVVDVEAANKILK